MSVLIKGAKMPDYCEDCSLYDWVDPVCRVSGVDIDDENLRGCRPGWCPLVEVPEKHGELIDIDLLIHRLSLMKPEFSFFADGAYMGITSINDIFKNIPVVVEAEGEDE